MNKQYPNLFKPFKVNKLAIKNRLSVSPMGSFFLMYNEKGDYYEYPLCMTAHCMAVNMTKVKEVGADKYIDTDKHTWSTDGFLKTVDALYKGGYENVAAIYCSGQGGDQGTRAIINNMYGGTFTDAAHTKYTADSAENIKAFMPITRLSIKLTQPRMIGSRRNLFFFFVPFSLHSTSISPSGFRTAIAVLCGPLIITPSIIA